MQMSAVADYVISVPPAVFALTDPAYVLTLSITRGVHKNEFRKGHLNVSCGLYGRVVHASKQKEDEMPSFRFSVWASTIADENPGLSRIDFTTTHSGIRLSTEGGEVNQIDKKERERLLDFLKNLRGFQIIYTADLFGFLNKDGSDEAVLIELPFPEVEEVDAEVTN